MWWSAGIADHPVDVCLRGREVVSGSGVAEKHQSRASHFAGSGCLGVVEEGGVIAGIELGGMLRILDAV